MDYINENYLRIRENIKECAKKSQRNENDILFVAVSKTFPVDCIQYAQTLGITDFGENKVQELTSKCEQLTENVNFHMIGHLQTNKVKQVVGKVKLIQSVDSLKLAQEIDRMSKMKNIISDYLIEINIAQENTKFGILPQHLTALVEGATKFSNIRLRGLMCIAENCRNAESNRKFFDKMRNLYIDIQEKNYDNSIVTYLSMGMSLDYQVAIEEGANIIRVGSGLFGVRQ